MRVPSICKQVRERHDVGDDGVEVIRVWRRGQHGGRGQSLLEFSLTIPIFLLVMLAIAEGGYYVVATTAVSHATHEGARLGVLESTADLAAVSGRVVDSASSVVALDLNDVSLQLNGSTCNPTCYTGRASGDRLGVLTSYTHTPLVGYVFSGITFQADASAERRVE
jgi:hypothetical protein